MKKVTIIAIAALLGLSSCQNELEQRQLRKMDVEDSIKLVNERIKNYNDSLYAKNMERIEKAQNELTPEQFEHWLDSSSNETGKNAPKGSIEEAMYEATKNKK